MTTDEYSNQVTMKAEPSRCTFSLCQHARAHHGALASPQATLKAVESELKTILHAPDGEHQMQLRANVGAVLGDRGSAQGADGGGGGAGAGGAGGGGGGANARKSAAVVRQAEVVGAP